MDNRKPLTIGVLWLELEKRKIRLEYHVQLRDPIVFDEKGEMLPQDVYLLITRLISDLGGRYKNVSRRRIKDYMRVLAVEQK